MIPVTKPFLPPQHEYEKYLDGIWQRNWLTNNGPLVNELELKLKEYLKVNHLLFLTNGTIAIQIAIKALDLKGEIITTPFSYVATTSSIVWEGCKPVFVDIDKNTLNLDPKKVEAAITPNTSAILATHVYGNPCDIDALQAIAQKHNLKVIYDAAHAFGTLYKGKSVFEFGDVSTASFHATKLFHTIEGGGVVTNSAELLKRMAYMRNFGHDGPEKFAEVGINGKNSEYHAAMGLVNLSHIDAIRSARKIQSEYYDKVLKNLKCQKPAIAKEATFNYAYYAVVLPTEEITLRMVEELNKNLIYPRRYFFPSLDELPYLERAELPITRSVSNRVLCLPLYHTLTFEEIDFVARIMLRVQNN
ncbi:MAG: DegT/DnrJ/EryC1/StrS family aminotransferase [Cyclobacteriaceae bacterium]|nr:DegT/DnrJ/EryC1/StrS family aminotransferase [Cyclobacteriaceae bacterium]